MKKILMTVGFFAAIPAFAGSPLSGMFTSSPRFWNLPLMVVAVLLVAYTSLRVLRVR